MQREQAYAALFAKVTAAMPSLKKFSRRLEHWNEVAPADQPALFMAQGAQLPNKVQGRPYAWILRGSFYVYAHSEDIDTVPAVLLNTLLDELESALAPDQLGRQNLGLDFVNDCRLSGEVETDDGLLGSQVIAILPFEIITTK